MRSFQSSSRIVGLMTILVVMASAGERNEIQTSLFLHPARKLQSGDAQDMRRYLFDPQVFREHVALKKNFVLKGFPVAVDRTVDLIMKRARSIIGEETRYLESDSNSQAVPSLACFTGTMTGMDGSSVYCIVANDFLFAILSEDGLRHRIIAPASDGGKDRIHLLHEESGIGAGGHDRPICFNESLESDFLRSHSFDSSWKGNDELLELELALETDTEFFKNTGGTIERAQAYALAVISLVSMLYEEQIGVTIHVPWYNCWTDSPRDPYDSKGDAYALPMKVMPYWRDNRQNVRRDLFHVMTSIGHGGGGFGYYDALCGKNGDYGFSVSSLQASHNLPTFSFTYDVYIVAHEIGHNFNSPHTHSCFWGSPLDTCMAGEGIQGKCLDSTQTPLPNPGSIMSYCGGTNYDEGLGWQVRLIFLPECISVMRQTAEKAACLTRPVQPWISLLRPRGQEVKQAGETIDVTWVFSGIDTVSIEYRGLNGAWLPVATGIPASRGRFPWVLPAICSDSVLIRVFDPSDAMVADTTLLPITILLEDSSGLVAFYPFNGDTKDEQQCHFWDAVNVGNTVPTLDRFGRVESARLFDGNSFLRVPDFKAQFDHLTVSAWFNASDLGGKRTIIGTNWQEGWVFEIYYWGQIGAAMWVDGSGTPDQVWGGTLREQAWHHVVFVHDGMNGSLYVNGLPAGATRNSTPHLLNRFITTLYIGSRASQEYFTGRIDDIRIYRRALSAGEIWSLFNESPVKVGQDEGAQNVPVTMTVYPTPSEHTVNLVFNTVIDGTIHLYDILGAVVKTSSVHGRKLVVAIEDLRPGFYFIRVVTRNNVFWEKFCILR